MQDVGLRAGPIPDLDGAVGAAPGQPLAVMAERHAQDRAGGVGQIVQQLPRRTVPELYGPVPASRGQQLPIAAERHALDTGRVPGLKDSEFLASGPIPYPDGAVRAARGELAAVRGTERHPVDRPVMALEDLEFLARRRLPD